MDGFGAAVGVVAPGALPNRELPPERPSVGEDWLPGVWAAGGFGAGTGGLLEASGLVSPAMAGEAGSAMRGSSCG